MFVQGSHAFAMFSAHALREKRGIPVRHAHTNVTTFTYFGQNWSIGCLLALYGSTKHPAQLCGGFGLFFLLSVLVSLKKKKKKKKQKSGVVGDVCVSIVS